MNFPVRAITLDLDDTLWPFAPIGERIERVLDAWMREHSLRTADRFPLAAMRELREQVFAEHPELLFDLGALRRLTLQRALADSGADPALADAAYDVFYAERNRVECYPDSLDALQRIAACVPVAALTNGNADLQCIGLSHHFAFSLGAREHGAAKPDAGIFHAACDRLGCAPGEVLHVGDDMHTDVVGAARAGLRTCWINRREAGADARLWAHDAVTPDLQFDTLGGLADWLDTDSSYNARTARA